MNPERIISFCRRRIKKAEKDNGGDAKIKAQALQEVIDYIKKAGSTNNEIEDVKKIFVKHYVKYHLEATGRKMQYQFTSAEHKTHSKNLVSLIKDYITTSELFSDDYPVQDFFEAFMERLPEWWKRNAFTLSSISRHFNNILTQMINNKKRGKFTENGEYRSNGSHKPTVSDVVTAIGESRREDRAREQ